MRAPLEHAGKLSHVTVGGKAWTKFDPVAETIDFPLDALVATPTLMGLASPIIANQMIGIFIPSFLTIAAVGQAAGARAVAALAMATTFANITGWSLVVGISEGCDTLASQAYGAGQHAVCGAILQRGVALSAELVADLASATAESPPGSTQLDDLVK